MKSIDSRFKFPKLDKSEVDRTMSIVHNVSELLEEKKVYKKRMYTYKEGLILKAEEADKIYGQQVNISILYIQVSKVNSAEIIQEEHETSNHSQFIPDNIDNQETILEEKSNNIGDELSDNDKDIQVEEVIIKQNNNEGETEKELKPRPFTKENLEKGKNRNNEIVRKIENNTVES